MPGKHREGTVFRGWWVDRERWEKALAKAKSEGRPMASVLDNAIREYVGEESSAE